MSIDDYKNGFKYNVLSLEADKGKIIIDEKFTYVRAGFCAIVCKMSEKIIWKYLLKALESTDPPVDAYIYILKYCIDNRCIEKSFPFIKDLFYLKKPDNVTLINHYFYDYTRYHLISVISLMSNQFLEIGYESCKKAIDVANKPEDRQNLGIFINNSKI
jgi:hypothetical protein